MHNKDSRPRARDRSVLEENLLCCEGPSRREVLKTGTAIAVSAGGAQLLACDAAAQGQDRDAAAVEQLRRANGDPRRRVLLWEAHARNGSSRSCSKKCGTGQVTMV
jgi:hypothetical protein